MGYIFYYVKITAIVKLTIIPLLFLLLLLLRVILFYQQKKLIIKDKEMLDTIKLFFKNQDELSAKQIKYFKKNIKVLLDVIQNFENKHMINHRDFQTLSNKILKAQGRKFSKSKNWLNQLYGARCFFYGFDQKDEILLIKLMDSDDLLVCLESAKTIFKSPNSQLVNKVINVLANGRRLNQSFFIDVLEKISNHEKKILTTFFIQRIDVESNSYIKAFCYRMLIKLIPDEKILSNIKQDIANPNIDLSIAALTYLSRFKNPLAIQLIFENLNHKAWQIRARVIKLLEQMKIEAAVPFIEHKLNDLSFWVRINAANALAKMGQSGIESLKKQDVNKDRYAYEAAQKALLTLEAQNFNKKDSKDSA